MWNTQRNVSHFSSLFQLQKFPGFLDFWAIGESRGSKGLFHRPPTRGTSQDFRSLPVWCLPCVVTPSLSA